MVYDILLGFMEQRYKNMEIVKDHIDSFTNSIENCVLKESKINRGGEIPKVMQTTIKIRQNKFKLILFKALRKIVSGCSHESKSVNDFLEKSVHEVLAELEG
jgi:hypothetical protein